MTEIAKTMGAAMTDGGDDEGKRWAVFVAALPPLWLPVAGAFREAFGVLEGHHEPDGSWTLDLTYGLWDLRRLLVRAPVSFKAVEASEDWWGDCHLESEAGFHASRDGRAIVTWSDHFSAGMSATLRVFTSVERFDAALSEARHRVSDSNADEGDDDSEEREDEGR